MLTPEELKIAQDIKSKGGTKDDAMYIIEQMRTKKPTSTVAPTQPYQKRYFSDEQKVVDQMKSEGYDDITARQTIENRRKDILGDTKLNKDEAQMLIKMADAGVPSTKAVEGLEAFRSDTLKKQWDNMNPLQKVGKTYFDFVVGTLAGGVGEVGGITDFLTGGKSELGKMGMEARDYNIEKNQGLASGAGRLFGEGVIDYSLAKGVGKIPLGGGATVASKAGLATIAPTTAGRAIQGVKAGALYGGLTQVGQKGAETTAGDITQGAVIGGTLGGVAGPVLEKAVIPAVGKVIQKGIKYGEAGLRGGITGVGKSIGRDIQGGIIKPMQSGLQKQGANISLGGIINPAKLDAVKKQLIVDEGVATPQDVGTWLLTRIKPGNKQEIADQLITYSNKTKGAVDESLAKIPTRFQNDNARKALQQLEQDLSKTAGMEGELARIQNLLKKTDYSLSELQEVKRELDNIYNIYKQSGEVSAGLKAQGLNNIRRDIKKFIEDKAGEFGVDIKRLNNDTAIARGLAEGIMKKDNADAVRELLNAFAPSGVGSVIGAGQSIAQGNDPFTVLRDAVIGGVIAKGLTSTRVRTNIGALLNKLGPKEMSQLEKFIKSGGTDTVGEKVAQDLIRRGRLLPAPGQTTIKPINLPAKGKLQKTEKAFTKQTGKQPGTSQPKKVQLALPQEGKSSFKKPAIITPQTKEKAIIQESKIPLKNTKNVTDSNNRLNNNNSNVSVKKPKIDTKLKKTYKPLTINKVLTKPQTQVLTTRLNNPTLKNTIPTSEDYRTLLTIIADKEGISINKARNLYGKYTYGQWKKLLTKPQTQVLTSSQIKGNGFVYANELQAKNGLDLAKRNIQAIEEHLKKFPNSPSKKDLSYHKKLYENAEKELKYYQISGIKSLKNPTPENITSTIEKSLGIKGKTEQIKKIVSDFIKREGTKWKEEIGEMLDEIATKIGAKLNFISDKGTGISGRIDAPKELIEEAKKYKSTDEFIDKKYFSIEKLNGNVSDYKIKNKNGYLDFSIDKDANELIIDQVWAYEKRKGTGTELIKVAEMEADKRGLDVSFAAEPQDGTITKQDLYDFYENLGYDNSFGLMTKNNRDLWGYKKQLTKVELRNIWQQANK